MIFHKLRRSALLAAILAVGVTALTPVAFAQAVASGELRQGEGQGSAQGGGQGEGQGGQSAADLGIGNSEVDQSTIVDTRLGAHQGEEQGDAQGTDAWRSALDQGRTSATAENAQTGAESTNTSAVATQRSDETSVANTSVVGTAAAGSATTGRNAANENTGPGAVRTGSASIGVEQVTADNLVTTGSVGDVSHQALAGGHQGDLVLGFNPATTESSLDESFRSVNRTTGPSSDNTAIVESEQTTLTEVQNDGRIDTGVVATALTGENEAVQNTGNAAITTGDANVAATLFNFLNATVVDGALWLAVADIFGDLSGNVVIPEDAIAYLNRRQRALLVEATNAETGPQSENSLDLNLEQTQTTTLANEADVENAVVVDAVTGQNVATQNTGGASIETGDIEATTNTVTLANLNVVDGNLGLIIVNALNRWLGFLLGSDGRWTAIDHEYSTLASATNESTGADSENTASVGVTETDTTVVTNAAVVRNDVRLAAVTGRNTAVQNTGNATINTGNARAAATVVNVVNTNVVRGGLFAVVVNVFGNWLGDLFFGPARVADLLGSGTAAASGSGGGGVHVVASNVETGTASSNAIDVDLDRHAALTVENTADIVNTLTVNADTGHNEANRNTGLGFVDTGDALAFLHARNIANVTVAGLGGGFAEITAELLNATTGADSTNTIDVTVNDERTVTVLNDAAVDTAIGAVANTGVNRANRNTLGGLVRTGKAGIEALVENLLNETWLVGDDPRRGRRVLALVNDTTGAASTNVNTADVNQETTATIVNTADVDTSLDAAATSGENQANRNTGGGAVASGGAAIAGAVDATVNQATVRGSVPGSFTLDVDNEATVDTKVRAAAETGGNEAVNNTGQLFLAPPPGGVPPPPSLSPGGPAAEGGAPPGALGVGGGPTIGEGGESRLEGVLQEEVVRRPPKRPVRKPAKPTVRGVAKVLPPPAALGEMGGGPAWSPGEVARLALSIPVAQAAPAPWISAPTVSEAPRPEPRGWTMPLGWPWVALVLAAVLGFSAHPRTRTLWRRVTGLG